MRRVAALLLPLVLLAGCGGTGSEAGGYHGATHAPYQVPATPLTDTDGQPYSLTRSTDKPLTLVFFGYTRCPDVCQAVMSTVASAMTRLDEADRRDVDVAFVSTDPARDTPQVLRRYLDHFDPSFIGLTGRLDTVARIGRPLAVYVADGDPLPGGGRDLNSHSTHVTGITADDTAPILWTADVSAADLAADIHTLLAKELNT